MLLQKVWKISLTFSFKALHYIQQHIFFFVAFNVSIALKCKFFNCINLFVNLSIQRGEGERGLGGGGKQILIDSVAKQCVFKQSFKIFQNSILHRGIEKGNSVYIFRGWVNDPFRFHYLYTINNTHLSIFYTYLYKHIVYKPLYDLPGIS